MAGIAAGSYMIKQAELRSLITDLQSYQTAYNNFLGRYSKVPGDMDVGSSYFPNCAVTAANCNGDGDGVIDFDDECPWTPAGVEVDEKGCPLDKDGDFVPNYKDDELENSPETWQRLVFPEDKQKVLDLVAAPYRIM